MAANIFSFEEKEQKCSFCGKLFKAKVNTGLCNSCEVEVNNYFSG